MSEGSVGEVPWVEPELDTDDERVISMYDGIRKILSGQHQTTQAGGVRRKTRVKKSVSIPRIARHTLECRRILKVDVEPGLVVITVEKLDGERRQLRIEARVQ